MIGFLKLLSKLPLRALYLISDIAYPIVFYLVRYRKQLVFKHLRTCFPEKDEKEIKRIAKKFYQHFCDMFAEVVKINDMDFDEARKHLVFTNTEEVNADLRNGKSVLLLMSHNCNWEFLTSLAPWLEKDTFICHVYKRLTNSEFDDFMRELRDKYGSHSTEQTVIFRSLVRARKTGKPVVCGFLADQSPLSDQLRLWFPFLNHEHTPFLDSPERLARSLGFGMYYVEMHKIARGRYEARFIKMCDNAAETPENSMTELYAKLLETTVKNRPEYYLWTHNRWKSEHLYPKDETMRGNNP